MNRIIAVFIFTVLAAACVQPHTEKSEPLNVVDVKINTSNKRFNHIRQVVVEFNQDIAPLGAVPNPEQTNAITISQNLHQQCQWRFVALNKLACELDTGLNFLSQYTVAIDDSFVALGKKLEQSTSKQITTGAPTFRVIANHPTQKLPSSFKLENYEQVGIPVSAFEAGLKLKLPNGEYEPLQIKEVIEYTQKRLLISPKDQLNKPDDGHYQLVFPPGFKASHSQIALQEELVVYDFWFDNEFVFYGFACLKERYTPNWITDIQLTEAGQLDCAPEQLAIATSQPIDLLETGYQPVYQVDWLKGNEYSVGRAFGQKGKVYHSLKLSGDSAYQLDLSSVKSISGSHLDLSKNGNPETLTFKTTPATPLWFSYFLAGNVVDADRSTLPSIMRRNVADIRLDVTVIKSAQDLLDFLNQRLDVTVTEALPDSASTKHHLNDVFVDFRKYLPNQHGMVNVRLSGLSSIPGVSNSELKIQTETSMLQAVDYDVLVWNAEDLLIQVIDHDAQPVAGATTSLVCEQFEQTILLGQTNVDGLVWFEAKQWQEYWLKTEDKECWIWAETKQSHAAIQLPHKERRLKFNLNAMAWAAQPIYQNTDVVNIGFIARTRSDNGLQPIKSLDNYTFTLETRGHPERLPLDFGELSEFGFANAQLTVPVNWPTGDYGIYIEDKTTKQKEQIGSFLVAEFNPPQFEVNVDHPEEVSQGQSVELAINANQMNGSPLQDASAEITWRIQRNYRSPSSWPKDFEFDSWNDFDNNQNGTESNKSKQLNLDNEGKARFVSEPLTSTVPYGRISGNVEVKADNGETQYQQFEQTYFSRPHYIGTNYNETKRALEIIAIDKNGNALHDISVSIAEAVNKDEAEDKTSHQNYRPSFSCKLSKLPGTCLAGDIDDFVKLEIVSTENHAENQSNTNSYKWYRSYSFIKSSSSPTLSSQSPFKLIDRDETLRVGESVEVELQSEFTGTATLILQAGQVRKVWNKSVNKGLNKILLDVEPSWVPYARLHASLPVGRELATERTVERIKSLDEKQKSEMHPRQFNQLLEVKRVHTSSIQLHAQAEVPPPEIKISVGQDKVEAGSEIELKLHSSQNTDVQVWLVNDAILNMVNKKFKDYDYAHKLLSRYAFEREFKFDALSHSLVVEDFEAMTGLSNKVQQRNRVPVGASSGISFNMPSVDVSSDRFDKASFAQSIWLKTLNINANEAQSITIKLPMLIGRWKILALAANNQQSSITTTTVTTHRATEYFLDVPSALVEGDKANLTIAQINQSNKPVTDSLTLWLNGKPIKEISVTLKANENTRLRLPIRSLPVGDHIIELTSQKQTGFGAQNLLTVNSAKHKHTQSYFITPSNSDSIDVQVEEASHWIDLEVLTKPAGTNSPDWAALSDWTQNYPHQCWEQTVSRAMSYRFNPLSDSSWPNGAEALNRLLSGGHSQVNYMGFYSFFPGMDWDLFLTGYSYFAGALLQDSTTPILQDSDKLSERMFDILGSSDISQYLKAQPRDKSMALLALAFNNKITLEEALKVRQQIGFVDTESMLLQALALKHLGADKSLYLPSLQTLLGRSYADPQGTLGNTISDKCLGSLVYEENSRERELLLEQIITQQQDQGDFGNSYANGICAYALKDQKYSPSAIIKPTFSINNDVLSVALENKPQVRNQWLMLNYSLPLDKIKSSSQGIGIERAMFVKRNQKWQQVEPETVLTPGDLIRTTLTLNSPVAREQIAVIDSIPGGFKAINPSINNKYYRESLGERWQLNHRIEIRNGKAHWYISKLKEGQQSLSYYSRVRHSGEYQVAPARVEAMYRKDVKANTQMGTVVIR